MPTAGGGDGGTEVRDEMEQACGHCPGACILQTEPAQCDPGEQHHQHVGRQEHEHVALDGFVDVIEDVHGDLSVRQRGSRESHQLSLVGVAGQQEKERQEEHHGCLTDQPCRSHGTRPQEVADFEARGLDDDARRRLSGRRSGACRLARRLLDLARSGLHLLYGTGLTLAQAGEAGRNLAHRFGQLIEYGLHLPTQRVRPQDKRAHDAHHHDTGTHHARDTDPLEPNDEGVQGVGEEDAEQQGNDKALRPFQRENHRYRSEDAQRHAPACPGHLDCGYRGSRVRTCRRLIVCRSF